MYDMSRVSAFGYFDKTTPEERNQLRRQLAAQRTADYKNGFYPRAGGVVDPLPPDAPQFVKDYHDYYKTPRGYHPRSLNSNDGWNKTSVLSFMNMPLLSFAGKSKTRSWSSTAKTRTRATWEKTRSKNSKAKTKNCSS